MRLRNAVAFAATLLATVVTAADTVKKCFPDDFLFGSATASYQVEGGWNATGRTASIWDDYCRANANVECANVADDFIHRYKEDIDLMVGDGLSHFRFSVSWTRVMTWDPVSKRMKPNAPGIAFYHDVIDTLLAKKIIPVLTMYHWDLPSALHTQLNPMGWISPEIVSHFREYADLLFDEYGSKVNFWTTFNEPTSFVITGYGNARHAPGLPQSTTNTYQVAHHVLLSHGYVVKRFRELKAANKIGKEAKIGIVLVTDYSYPLDPSNPDDVDAADRKMEFMFGWFLRPIVYGEYPAIMRKVVGDRLPTFTAEETTLMKGSYDIFMLNHYFSRAVTDCTSPRSAIDCSHLTLGWERDHGIDDTHRMEGARRSSKSRNGEYLCEWFSGYPQGYLDTIRWMHKHDKSAQILLTENGWCGDESLDNPDQNWYFEKFIEKVHTAMTEEKIPIIGYTAWSFLDNYEWGSFNPRFGLYYVNYTSQTGSKNGYEPKPTDLQRIPRTAAKWFAKLAKTKCMEVVPEEKVVAAALLSDAGSDEMSAFTRSSLVVVPVVAVAAAAALDLRRRRAGTAGENAPLLRP
jgi:beta-glucosidase/6-phospho-beta-glucosidase/beta-galactosidase